MTGNSTTIWRPNVNATEWSEERRAHAQSLIIAHLTITWQIQKFVGLDDKYHSDKEVMDAFYEELIRDNKNKEKAA